MTLLIVGYSELWGMQHSGYMTFYVTESVQAKSADQTYSALGTALGTEETYKNKWGVLSHVGGGRRMAGSGHL